MNDIMILLDNIRSAHNAASIFRTAECAGVSKIYCLGTTPGPVDRFNRKRRDFAKVALGTEDLVQWQYIEAGEIAGLFKMLKNRGFRIIAFEQSADSINFKKMRKVRKALLIFGNEVDGLGPNMLKKADVVAEIPLKGKKESLNVSVAVGVALFS